MDLQTSDMKDIFLKRSRTAIVLGNGPSMCNFEAKFQEILARHNPIVVGVNRIFKEENKPYRPVHYYVAADRTLWQNHWQDLKDLRALRYFCYARFQQKALVDDVVTIEFNTDNKTVSRDQKIQMGHNHTSTALAAQMALIQGAEQIYFFGVDCAPDKDGKTHNHGNERRKKAQWDNITKGFLHVLEKLREYNIGYIVYSDIFQFSEISEYRRTEKPDSVLSLKTN